ncbi:MAG: hypothetical protein N3F66_03695 [Spirochaetes bacterium]|nr:hypothetical protein [Spirochaetota bacterium]
MTIETTTCISRNHLDVLKKHAQRNKLSLHTFIVNFINYVISYKTMPVKGYTRLRYRQRHQDVWKRVHLFLYEHEYEFLMDVRKVTKMSLARVIAYCVDNYLFDFLDALSKDDNTDNYRCSGYTFGFFLEDGIPCCHFYWGPPPQILQKTPQ